MRLSADGRPLDVATGLQRLPRAAAARGDVDAVWLFGSYGTDRQTPLSDVDIAVLPRLGTPSRIRWRLACEAWLAETLACDAVDLLRMDAAPLWLQAEAAMSGRLLYVREPFRLADYLETLWRDWGDFAIDWLAFQTECRHALARAVSDGR